MLNAEMDDSDEASAKRLDAVCGLLKELRDEAIQGRANSGVEQIWREDEEYYDGIDDSNRESVMLKPSTKDGNLTRLRKKKGAGSTIFVNLTAQYVNAAAAHVADKLIPSDEPNYGMEPTPKPSLIEKSKDVTEAMDESGQPMSMPVMDEAGNPQEQPHMVNGQPMTDNTTGQPIMIPATKGVTVGDLAKEDIKKAKVACEKASVQIDDWLSECGSNRENRQVVNDAARIGTGVLKGPYPEMVRKRAILNTPNGVQMVMEERIVPKSCRISVWNLWPDPSCGEDIHRGRYIFQDDEINSRRLEELKKDQSYIASAIDKVLGEGPKNSLTGKLSRKRGDIKDNKEVYQIWYYHGSMSMQDMEDCGYKFKDEAVEAPEEGLMDASMPDTPEHRAEMEAEDDGREAADYYGEEESSPEEPEKKRTGQCPCIVMMVNDTIIKATMSQFDSGRFPYQVMRWEYRAGHWAGKGVARQMRTSQDGVNAGVRMMHDNAGVSARPIPIINRQAIAPVDGVTWTLGAGSAFYTTDEFDGGNIRDAVTWIIAPSNQVEMMNIIQFWMGMAEKETGLPALLQGQQSDRQSTLGEIQTRTNNGNAMLRRVTNIYDDDVTKHHINGYYEWLLLHGEDDSMKGEFTIIARGSSVLIERDAQGQFLAQMLASSQNPAFGVDPELWFRELLLSQRFDADKLLLSEEKKAEMAKRQPPQDPRIAVAEINAKLKKELEQLDDKDIADHAAANASLEMARQRFENQQNQVEVALRQWEKNMDAQLEAARQGGDKSMNDDNLKVSLARDAMKLRAQISLAMKANQNAPQVANATMEPKGRAPNGQGFQR